MKNFKVGIQLYGLRTMIEEEGIEATLKAVKAIGYDYIESAGVGFYNKSADEAKELLKKLGLTLISAHTRDTSDENLALLSSLGTKAVSISYHPLEKFQDEWEQSAKFFRESSLRAAKYGMRLFYHNHSFEFTNDIGGKKIIDKLFFELGDVIAPQFDVCWANYGGSDPAGYIRKYESLNLYTAHLKDFTCNGAVKGEIYDPFKNGAVEKTRAENLFRYMPVGAGVVDFDAVLSACEDTGIEAVIVEQDESYETHCLEAARQSREYLKKNYGI